MLRSSVDIGLAYLWLSDWTRLQWALRSLIFGVQHSDFLEVKTKTEIHNNGLLGEGKIERFYLDVCKIIGNFNFSIDPVETLGLISPFREGANFFFGRGGIGQLSVTYRTHAALPCGCSAPVAE